MARSPINHSFYGQGPLAPLSGRSQQGGYSPSMQMAQQLMQDGSSMAPVQSVTEGAARALRGGLGGYMNYATMKAMGDEQKLTGEQTNAILQAMIPSEAVEGQDDRPETMIPGGNPHMEQALAQEFVEDPRVVSQEQPQTAGTPGYAGRISPAQEAIAPQEARTAMQNALAAYGNTTDPTAATTAMGQQLMMARAGQDWQTAQLAEQRAYDEAQYIANAETDAKYGTGSNAETWGKTPQWLTNPAGEQVFGVISSHGNFKEVDTGDLTPNRSGLTSKTIGNEVIWTDALGTVVKRVPIGLPPERSIVDGQVITLPAVPGAGGHQPLPEGGLSPEAQLHGSVNPQLPGGVSTVDLPQSVEDIEKTEGRRQSAARSGGTVIQDLQRGLNILEGGDWDYMDAVTSPVSKNIKLTDAGTVEAFMQSALSNVGLDTLQNMRDNSPTGGALGQVPIQQQKRLEQVLGSLDLSQRPDVVRDNVRRVINLYKDIVYGTPENIAALVAAGKIAPEVAAQASERHTLSFDELGNPITPPAADTTELDAILNKYLVPNGGY